MIGLAKASDISHWADKIESRSQLPELIRRLVLATTQTAEISFPAYEEVDFQGWDGYVSSDIGSSYVPQGISAWELGTGSEPHEKASGDYLKRTKNPRPVSPNTSSFVFVTPRIWREKKAWVERRIKKKEWSQVRAYDADDLSTWLATAPAVHLWYSSLIGISVEGMISLEGWYEAWCSATSPHISSSLLLSGRQSLFSILSTSLSTRAVSAISIRAESEDEALALVAATMDTTPEDHRTSHFSRAIIVDSPGAWKHLSAHNKPLILIPRFADDALIRQAVERGHHVIVPLGNDYTLPVALNAPRLSAIEAEEILKQRGLTTPRARHLASLLRRSLPAFRRMWHKDTPQIPPWVTGSSAGLLWKLVLVGSWHDRNINDQHFITLVTGREYSEISHILRSLAAQADAPFRITGTLWNVNDKEDSWRMLARLADAADIRVILDHMEQVFLTADVGRHDSCSDDLLRGLADSIAMLGALGTDESQIKTADGSTTAAIAAACVRRLLMPTQQGPSAWIAFSEWLPFLAESSPDEFMGAIDRDLRSATPPDFAQPEEHFDLFTPQYSNVSLLWALENLAWSSDHFMRVNYILAKIVALAPRARTANGPMQSLLTLHRLWFPQCGATLALRLAAIDRLRVNHSEVAWELMLRLIGTRQDTATVSSGPGHRAVLWREWPSEGTPPTNAEYNTAVLEISFRLVKDLGSKHERWLSLVAHFPDLHPEALVVVFEGLQEVASQSTDEDFRRNLWTRIRDLVTRHRQFPSADWAFSQDILDQLDAVAVRLEPNNPEHKHIWLFDWSPQLPRKVDRKEDWVHEREKEIASLRRFAIQEIIAAGGLDAVARFAQSVGSPISVGYALFDSDADADVADWAFSLLEKPEPLPEVAQGYCKKAINEYGPEWMATWVSRDRLDEMSINARLAAITCLPLSNVTLDLVETLPSLEQRAYWRTTQLAGTSDQAFFRRSLSMILNLGLARRAVDDLAMYSYSPTPFVEPGLVVDALRAYQMTTEEDDPTEVATYDIEQLLRYLQAENSVQQEVIEELEWDYLPELYLNVDNLQLRLHSKLSEDPVCFVKMVGYAYRRDNQEILAKVDPELASRALKLLKTWNVIPGMGPDGEIDETFLHNWIESATELLKTENLIQAGSLKIGEMLQNCPYAPNGQWPPATICEVIEHLDNDLVDEAFVWAVYNSRGATVRGVLEGGLQERELATRYDSLAKSVGNSWPRTGAALRKLASIYNDDARREDADAEAREDRIG